MDQYVSVTPAEAAQTRDGVIKLHGAEGFEGMRKAGLLAAEILDALVFRQFDDNAIGAKANLVEQIKGSAVSEERVVKAVKAGIDEQFAGQLETGKGAEDRLTTGAFQVSPWPVPVNRPVPW